MNIPCSDNNKSAQSIFKGHYALIDYLRGIAIILMIIYHFFFDLNYYQLLQNDFYFNPWWVNFRIIIVSLFLWLVGISLFLSGQNGINTKRFIKRLLYLSIAAMLVSLSSYITFPQTYIYFGILHFILVASLVGLLFLKLHYTNLVLGLVIIILGTQYSNAIFDHDALHWVGLMTHKPRTEDYAPFLPWFGVVLIGIYSGSLIFKKRSITLLSKIFTSWTEAKTPQQVLICRMGQHSLLLYLVHQPILMGILFVVKQILGDSV